jgi:hypothetical protein
LRIVTPTQRLMPKFSCSRINKSERSEQSSAPPG